MTSVAIIGGGPAGLTAAKSCLEEGLEPVIYESAGTLGGVWRNDSGLAWKGMRTNLSKWSCMFSDFPWPEGQQDFPSQADMARYLKAYADYFKVTERIRFHSPVLQAEKIKNVWQIKSKTDEAFHNSLIVASGFFSKPHYAEINIRSPYVSHSAMFRRSDDYLGKDVAVIGGSFSGYEIAAELARQDIKVTHILKNPAWMTPRCLQAFGDLPLDIVFNARAGRGKSPLPETKEEKNLLQAEFFSAAFGNPGNIHPDLDIDPVCGKPNFVAISEDYLQLVDQKRISVQKGAVTKIQDNIIHFKDGRDLLADRVILATGFSSRLDFMDEAVLKNMQFDETDQFMPLPLHKATWPQEVDKLAFCGFYRGPYFNVMELQGRWIAAVMSGACKEPEINVQDALNLKALDPRPQFPYSDYIGLCDSIAQEINVMPNLDENDELNFYSREGTVIPAQYRLSGRHSKRDVAENIIRTLPGPQL